MSSHSRKYEHPLDAALTGRNMFFWFGPALALLARHWPVALAAGLATVLLEWLLALLPWPSMALAPWWLRALNTFLGYALLTVVPVIAYCAIAHREGARYGVGDVNPVPRAILCAVQVSIVWLIGAWVVVLALGLIAGRAIKLFAGSQSNGTEALIALLSISIYGLPLCVFLLSPVWMMLGVAGALANAHAARSAESGLAAVMRALRLAFGQGRRVLWPAYLIGAVIAALIYLEMKLHLLPAFVGAAWFERCLSVAAVAVGVVMTFVIERAYAPDLGIEPVNADAPVLSTPPAAPPAMPPRAPATSTTPPQIVPAAAAPVGPAIAELIERDLRVNSASELADLVERGLTADARFFADHPESTVALAKRMVQAQRPDLALRILQPYVKDHQGHRLHLTGALLAAELLARDANQLPAAARFLARVKVLYPDEPMVDRLIRLTDKAIAESGSASPQPPSVP